ncbi:acetate uptake transporter family protein [Fodinicola acaciae]|uniref:acetate uptake transporter family protein n=1 Tax=Fodinicola acaciae TaxID=2681555 RepID=UPI001C9E5454|nr:GPR1/FUN34/YaaH family transporter [Fodinicola acaciae]
MSHVVDTQRTAEGPPDFGFWREHTQISLSPLAAPSILGLYGFAASTFIVAGNLAGWFGDNATTPLILFPFAFAFGGIAQPLAAMWAYRARDALATGIHGTWGSFWIGYGIYQLMIGPRVAPAPTASPAAQAAFGFWFAVLAAITWVGVLASLGENLATAAVLLTLAAGSTLLAIGMIVPVAPLVTVGAIVLVASACLAWYTASAMVLDGTYKRVGCCRRESSAPIPTNRGPCRWRRSSTTSASQG